MLWCFSAREAVLANYFVYPISFWKFQVTLQLFSFSCIPLDCLTVWDNNSSSPPYQYLLLSAEWRYCILRAKIAQFDKTDKRIGWFLAVSSENRCNRYWRERERQKCMSDVVSLTHVHSWVRHYGMAQSIAVIRFFIEWPLANWTTIAQWLPATRSN